MESILLLITTWEQFQWFLLIYFDIRVIVPQFLWLTKKIGDDLRLVRFRSKYNVELSIWKANVLKRIFDRHMYNIFYLWYKFLFYDTNLFNTFRWNTFLFHIQDLNRDSDDICPSIGVVYPVFLPNEPSRSPFLIDHCLYYKYY